MRRPAAEETTEEETVEETPAEETTEEETVEEPETTDFSAMTKAELLTYAEENGFEVTSSMTKAEIISVITGE